MYAYYASHLNRMEDFKFQIMKCMQTRGPPSHNIQMSKRLKKTSKFIQQIIIN